MSQQESNPPTVDRLRADIDRGQSGDKVPGLDPAAAPLGTDAEAGGAPPTVAERSMEAFSRPQSGPEATQANSLPQWILATAAVVLLLFVLIAMLTLGH